MTKESIWLYLIITLQNKFSFVLAFKDTTKQVA